MRDSFTCFCEENRYIIDIIKRRNKKNNLVHSFFSLYLLGYINNEITRKSREPNRDKTYAKIKDNFKRKRWKESVYRAEEPLFVFFFFLDWIGRMGW